MPQNFNAIPFKGTVRTPQDGPTMRGGGGGGGRDETGFEARRLNPSAAGPFGSAVTTNPLIAARYPPSLWPNAGTLQGSPTVGAGYIEVRVDRPTILRPFAVSETTVPPYGAPTGPLLYWPDKIPASDAQALRSVRTGICYFAGPGKWYVAYRSLSSNDLVQYSLIDASDSSTAARYLSEPGCNQPPLSTVVSVTNAAGGVTVAVANMNRSALLLQNSTAQPIVVTLGPIATTTSGMRMVNATTTIFLTGETCWRGAVSGISEGVTAANLFVTEWVSQ